MSDAPIDRHETLRLQFKEAMDWGRSYGTRLNLSSITVQDVSGQYADIALAKLDALAKAEDSVSKEQYRSMFHSACADLGAISDVLGVDPDEGGAEPILAAIADLQALADLATPLSPQPEAIAVSLSEAHWPVEQIASDVCQAVAELGDRNSPEGQPAMMLVTAEELFDIVKEAVNAATQPLQEVPHV